MFPKRPDHINPMAFIFSLFKLWVVFGLTLFIFLTTSLTIFAQKSLNLYQLPLKGLSDVEVRSIYQDHDGFLWFGTVNGLNRFDGHNYLQFHYEEDNPGSLSSNQINTIIEDADQNLWIGTKYGLNKFNRNNHTFIRYLPTGEDSSSIPGKNIKVLFVDQEQQLWIGTNAGLSKYLPKENHFVNYFHQENNPNSLGGNSLNQIIQDSKGRLWIGTNYSGVSVFEPKTGQFINYRHETDKPGSLSGNTIISLFEDSYQNIWIGTIRSGLNRFDEDSHTFKRYNQGPHHGSIATNSIYSIMENMDRDLIIGGMQGGMSIYNRTTDTFIRYNTKGKVNLKGNTASVLTDFTTKDKQILIATSNGGVNIYDNYPSNFTSFQHSPGDEKSLSLDHVTAVLQDKKNKVWIGTDGGGINLFDQQKGQFSQFLKSDNAGGLMDNTVLSIATTRQENTLLLSTQFHGLVLFDVEKKSFVPLKLSSPPSDDFVAHTIWNTQNGNTWLGAETGLFLLEGGTNNGQIVQIPNIDKPVHCILEIAGTILAGTDGGLYKIKPTSEFQTVWLPLPKQSKSEAVSQEAVLCLSQNGEGILLGTKNQGIWLLEKGHYYRLSGDHPSQSKITNISWTNKEIWFTTDEGLYRGTLDKRNLEINITGHYTTADGLTGNHFSRGSLKKLQSGHFLIGGIRGLNLFHPDSLQTNPLEPPIVFTDLYIDNKKIPQGTPNLLEKDINEITRIALLEGSNDISLEFSSLNFIKPEKNQYAYKLEGYEKEWIYTSTSKATYADLPPGKYTFKVIGSNNDGVWNQEGKSIDIVVKSTFWKGLSLPLTIAGALLAGLGIAFFARKKKQQISPDAGKATSPVDTNLFELPSEENKGSEDFINKARAIVISNLQNEEFDVNMLCRELGTSRSQLYRKFKEQDGHTVSSFIKEIKLSRAEHLLQNSELSITEVGQLSGFKSASHFTKSFQARFGITPSEYHRKHKTNHTIS